MQQPNGLLQCGDSHAPLRGYFPKRFLLHQLIFIFLFLSPVTFSNNDIPNFEPVCEITSSLSEKALIAVSCARRSYTSVIPVRTASLTPRYSLPAPRIPTVEEISLTTPSRAPPA